jgi:hypothetical protein
MDEARPIAVSPRHRVLLAPELYQLVEAPPRRDFVVRTLARKQANDLPLMEAELVIAGTETLAEHERARTYPLHFRKTYFPGRMGAETREEFAHHLRASELTTVPPPIGCGPRVFRSCLIPGQPYSRLTPFGGQPPESNLPKAQKLELATAAGLWRMAEETLVQLLALHEGGLAHGDAELHNVVVSPSPLAPVLIDFEVAVRRDEVTDAVWHKRRALDLEPLLREAIFLQAALGRQTSRLGELSWESLERLFKQPDRFKRAIETQGEV